MADGEEVAVSAVVVAFREVEELEACLGSLVTALARVPRATEVIVVDNSPTGSPVKDVRERFPQVSWLEQGENRGFAGGVQAGIDAARGAWVLTLNDDATIEPGAVVSLLETGEHAGDVGAVAALMRFAGSGRINSAGIVVDRAGVAADRLLGAPPEAAGSVPVEVFGASAGAALYRRAMLGAIGGFDATFFAYLEDVDVAWRSRMAGWRTMLDPRAVVHHHHSSALGHGSPAKHRLVGRNRVRLLAKDLDGRTLLRALPQVLAFDLALSLHVLLVERSPAALAGRLAGLREWRTYRRAGAATRRRISLPAPAGLRAARRRNAAWPEATGRAA